MKTVTKSCFVLASQVNFFLKKNQFFPEVQTTEFPQQNMQHFIPTHQANIHLKHFQPSMHLPVSPMPRTN